MNARDELAELIWDEDACDWRHGPNEAAQAILDAGYRKNYPITIISDEPLSPAAVAEQITEKMQRGWGA